MGRDIIARGMASGAIKVNINAGHIFVDNTARDAYFVTNPSELVENMYVYCDSKLQQYDGSIWVDRTPAIKGETGAGVPTGGTTNQVLTKNSNGDYDFSWIDLADGGDMFKSFYDTANKQVDVYDMDNMEDGTTYVKTENNFTNDYKNKIDNTSGTNTGDETNATIITKIGYTPENTLNKGVNNGYCGLDSGGKVPLQNLPSTLLKYIGTWNAETNTPSLTATDLTKVSHVYVVSHDGTQFGITWKAGDWLIYDADGVAEKSDNSDDVVSVNGKTGVVVINKADVGLSNVDNTSDLDKPISNLTQTALNLKADNLDLTTHTNNTDNPHGVTKAQVGLSNVDNTSDLDKPISSLTQTALDLKADGTIVTAHNTNTSNPHNVTKSQVGLDNVDNTSDLDKPISTLTQTALNLKADDLDLTAHTTNTDNPHGVTKAQVGLSNVVNVDTSVTTNIADTTTKRFVSDTEKTIWSVQKNERSGITWTSISIEANEWRGCVLGNGRFVTVARTGTHRAMYSTDAITWTPVEVPLNAWNSITFGNGRFVAVSNSGTNRVMHSIDGINWTTVVVDLSEWLSVTYANGLFVAVAMGGVNNVMYSTDAITWTSVKAPSEMGQLRDITYGNGRFVAVAKTGTHRVMYSTDAITWTPVVVESSDWYGITFGNGRFVAVAHTGTNRVMHSVDGINWTPIAVDLISITSVAYGNGLYVAVSEHGAYRSMYSLDATNWYYNTVPASNWRNIQYVNDMFIAFAYLGDVRLMTSGRYLYSDKVRVVKKSVIGELPVTIFSTEWTGTEPFEDTIPITIAGEQITNTTHEIKVSLVLSSDINIAKQEQEAYSYFSKGEISDTNTLKITCFEYKPTVDLNLTLEVVKKW